MAATSAVLGTYATVGEQTQKIIQELAGLQRRHFEKVHELHKQMHPRTLQAWRDCVRWALEGCGMPQHRQNLRDECEAVATAVDDMARLLVDWVDTETELPPADLADLALGTLDANAPTV